MADDVAGTPKIKVGDPVLIYGNKLEVLELKTSENGIALAQVGDPKFAEIFADAKARVAEIRERQATASSSEHAALAEEIGVLDREVRKAKSQFGLRQDLLTWWEERGAWVSEGRILSDFQTAIVTKLFSKPKPGAHRDAFLIYESLSESRIAEIVRGNSELEAQWKLSKAVEA